jgi:hypothetical protein
MRYKIPPLCKRFREEKSTVEELGGYFWVTGPHPHDDELVIVTGPFSEDTVWRFFDDPGGYVDTDDFVMFDIPRAQYERCRELITYT